MTAPVNAPPKPAQAPDVHLKNPETRKPPRTLKGDLKALKGKADKAAKGESDNTVTDENTEEADENSVADNKAT